MNESQQNRMMRSLHAALVAQGIPVVSVSFRGIGPAYVEFDRSATAPQIAAGLALARSWDYSSRGPRTLLAIRADLVALTAAQKNAVWADITSGSPPKWSTDAGPNAAALAAIQMLGASATLSAADVLEAKIRGVAMYVQDNPLYLVKPAFDVTINVPGDQPVPSGS